MSKVEGLSPRAFRISSRTRLAISILSRQSGSMVAGGRPSTGGPPTASRLRSRGVVLDVNVLVALAWPNHIAGPALMDAPPAPQGNVSGPAR